MTSILPIGIGQILLGAVESARLELKASWDPSTTGGQVLQTLCAFANDLQNLNGGYIVLGVEERTGVAVRPVRGLREAEIDAAQKWIRGNCNRIEPTHMPVFNVPEIDGQRVLVLWAPASDHRPHQAPDGPGARKYWVRIGRETVIARDAVLDQLMQQTARVPFDDRRAFDAGNDDLRGNLVREFLADVQSDLRYEQDSERVYQAMQIVVRANGHTTPRNIGLMLFSETPERWFRGARIELAEFSDDAGGNLLEAHVQGPDTSSAAPVPDLAREHDDASSREADSRSRDSRMGQLSGACAPRGSGQCRVSPGLRSRNCRANQGLSLSQSSRDRQLSRPGPWNHAGSSAW